MGSDNKEENEYFCLLSESISLREQWHLEAFLPASLKTCWWVKWHHQYLSGNVANGHRALTTSFQLRTNATLNGEYWLFEIFRDGYRSLNNVQFMEMTFQPISVLSQFYFPFHSKWITNMKRCEAISHNCFGQWTPHFNTWLRMEIHWSYKSLLF